MPLASAEMLLISALLNNHDVLSARSYGVSPEHFLGYRAEYNWLLGYQEQYGTEPTWDAFKLSFPGFIKCDHEDVRSACDMVYRGFNKRTLTTAITDSMDQLGMGQIDAAYDLLVKAQPLRTSAKPRKLLTDLDFLDTWDERSSYVEVPYPTLQRNTGGMKPGQIWYLAARPKNGKSAHLGNMVTHAVLTGNRVKFYSLEMSEAEVRARFHAALATRFGYKGITLTSIRDRTVSKDNYKEFVTELQGKLEDSGGSLDIHTPKEGMVTPGMIASSADEYHVNVVDYIGLMRQDSGARAVDDWRNLASISNDLKLTAMTANTSLLVASQINRDGEMGKEPPKLSNLAGSDALGQDGDVVLTMRAYPHNVASVFSIEGNRHGASAKFYTVFDPERGQYTEINHEQAEGLSIAYEERM